jgi:beta-lactamase regulating signal transducer with metallopeptidase domain
VSALEILLAQPLPRAITMALMHFLWQGAIAAAGLALVLGLTRRRSATLRYAVCSLTMAAMAVAPVLTTWIVHDGITGRPTTWRGLDSVISGVSDSLAVGAPSAGEPISLLFLQPWILFAWGLGVAVSATRLALAHRTLIRARSAARPAPEGLQARFDSLMRLAGARAQLALTEWFDTPTLVGWLRPIILIPASVATSLPPAQLEHILVHELAHIRRHDVLVNLLQTLAEALLFFHPAIWWVSRQVRIERERCCDARAVELSADPVGYARALTELAALRLPQLPSPAVGLASSNGGSLMSRIEHVLTPHVARRDRSTFPLAVGLAATLLLASLLPISAQTVTSGDASTIARQVELLERANAMRARSAPQVRRALDDPDPLTRGAAARVLGEMSDTVAGPALIAVLRDADAVVRKEGTVALGILSHGPAVPTLTGLLSDADPGVREQAAYAIAIIGSDHEAQVPAILPLLADSAANVRKGAARALGVMGSASATAPLRRLLADQDAGVRSAAERALGLLPGGDRTNPNPNLDDRP